MISRMQSICLATLVLGDVLLSVVSLWALPDRVPVHWNFRGQVDRYGSPWELAIVFPIIAAASAGLFLALPTMGRAGSVLKRSRTAYGRLAIAIVAGFVGIHAVVLLGAFGKPIDVLSGVLFILGGLLLALGNWMGKIRRNGIVGIRTPWTLKNDMVWERTHRVGGRLQVAHGLAVLLAAFLLPAWAAFFVLIGGLLALAVWAMFYSWWLDRGAAKNEAA